MAFLTTVVAAGCFGSHVDMPDAIAAQNLREVPLNGTLRFLDPAGEVVVERELDLRPAGQDIFQANLTSDVDYRALVTTTAGALTSEPFVTGLGAWQVRVFIDEDVVRISTVHGD